MIFKIGDKVHLKEDAETLFGVKFLKNDELIIDSFIGCNFCKCKREDGKMIITGSENIQQIRKPFEECMNPPIDPVNHPSHYESGKFECIEVMEEALGVDAVKSFCLCNAFKYLYRHNRKNGDEDIRKAKWYLDHYCSLLDKEVE